METVESWFHEPSFSQTSQSSWLRNQMKSHFPCSVKCCNFSHNLIFQTTWRFPWRFKKLGFTELFPVISGFLNFSEEKWVYFTCVCNAIIENHGVASQEMKQKISKGKLFIWWQDTWNTRITHFSVWTIRVMFPFLRSKIMGVFQFLTLWSWTTNNKMLFYQLYYLQIRIKYSVWWTSTNVHVALLGRHFCHRPSHKHCTNNTF